MSWLFSQALGEAFSAGTSLDGEQFAQLNVMPTPHKFWRNDKTMDACDLSRFGLTLRLLTDDRGEELLMSYLAAFPARTSASQGGVMGLKESVAGFGWKWPGSLAKYDQASCTWKTRQCSLLGGWGEFSETWPQWGSMLDGELLAHPISMETTTGKESGYWATPTATDWKGAPKLETVERRKVAHPSGVRLPEHIARQLGIDITTALNPAWSERLMTWPIGWTDLKPLETARFREWQQQHGGF